jgi:hypothetical protein
MAYITYHGRHMMEVRCKGCQKPLVVRRGPAQNLRMDRTNDYAELVIEMCNPDGQLSKHETPMCHECADRLRTTGGTFAELKALYDEDMKQHYASTVIAGHAPKEVERMLAKFTDRMPLRALSERGRGETFI